MGVACAGVSDFDASLFRISSAEAAAMDAQQRLLLEVGHEVVAAAAPTSGSRAKVQSLRLLANMWQEVSPVLACLAHLHVSGCKQRGVVAGPHKDGCYWSVCWHQLQRVRPANSCADQRCEHLHCYWRQPECCGRCAFSPHSCDFTVSPSCHICLCCQLLTLYASARGPRPASH